MAPSGAKRKKAPSISATPPKKQATLNFIGANSTSSSTYGSNAVPVTAVDQPDIINRTFYPPEISAARCQQYDNGELPRPLDALERCLSQTASERAVIGVGAAVVHWFKRDLRLMDNRALSMASDKANNAGLPLICVFIISPQDYEAHLTAATRVDFELRSLAVLKGDLAELDIPLHIETVEKRKRVPERLQALCEGWGAKHVFCNVEYEVDELRREEMLTRRCLDAGIDFTPVHDDVIVAPGRLRTGSGNHYAVYTPWYRAWMKHIHEHPHLLDAFESPTKNPPTARKTFKSTFEAPVPPAPSNKVLSPTERTHFAALYPAGEHEAADRLATFLTTRIKAYEATRNFPAQKATSNLSVHLAAGTLAARTAVRSARSANSSTQLDGGAKGIVTWISEIAWRDFYRHVLAAFPYVCMHKPFKPAYASLRWNPDPDGARFAAWAAGRTGFPAVDAAMRQLTATGYMHNRMRMVAASFLAKDLLLDWRAGERFFMLHLVDGDFASNSGGWGFAASVGVDPQPYFRIFNPTLQGERFDAEGEYIRTWVPELRDIEGKAVHDPYERGAGAEAERNGYPRPIVNHKEARALALERYKEVSGAKTG